MIRLPAIAPQVVPFALSCGLVLAGVVVSFLTLWRAHILFRASGSSVGGADPHHSADLDLLKQDLQSLQKQVQDARQYAPLPMIPPAPRSGLNLEKRAQALRLHRRGEAPSQIAAMLELPLQEVELLIKVHRIVLRSIR
jgi:hypothetical protein